MANSGALPAALLALADAFVGCISATLGAMTVGDGLAFCAGGGAWVGRVTWVGCGEGCVFAAGGAACVGAAMAASVAGGSTVIIIGVAVRPVSATALDADSAAGGSTGAVAVGASAIITEGAAAGAAPEVIAIFPLEG